MSRDDRSTSDLRRLQGHALLTELVEHGYLSPGDQFVFHQPRRKKTFRCQVTGDRQLLVEHLGVSYSSASTAARAAAGGKSRDGLTSWCRASDGASLWDLREQLIQKLTSKH